MLLSALRLLGQEYQDLQRLDTSQTTLNTCQSRLPDGVNFLGFTLSSTEGIVLSEMRSAWINQAESAREFIKILCFSDQAALFSLNGSWFVCEPHSREVDISVGIDEALDVSYVSMKAKHIEICLIY